jgi:arylsulfatase
MLPGAPTLVAFGSSSEECIGHAALRQRRMAGIQKMMEPAMTKRFRWTRAADRYGVALLATAAFTLSSLVPVAAQERPGGPAINPLAGIVASPTDTPTWPQQRRAVPGAPNVLLIMTDDVGFGSSGTFGGLIPTPTLDGLARTGLRYNQFNTTALCAPSRASLLTGRNPHNVGMGKISPAGYEGYSTVIPASAAMIPQVLREAGYATAAFGKWHLTPQWEQSFAGPFDRWPTGRGFDHFYGFLDSDTSQWNPVLIDDLHPIDPAAGHPGYNLDDDLADQSIAWIKQQHAVMPDRPFFVYYATGTAHAPHHAPKEWIEKFKGKFDQGWDVVRQQIYERQIAAGIIPKGTQLTPRPDGLPAWSSLSADQKRLYARMMEVYAGALAHMDHEVGRLIDYLKDSGQYDNTLIIFIQGDNGSSAEGGMDGAFFQQASMNGLHESVPYMLSRIDELGGATAYNHFPAGWAWAMDTPFRYYKQVASYFGGTRNGLVISWPKKIHDVGGLCDQFHFISDIAPTIYAAAQINPPSEVDGIAQKPLDGVPMNYTFDHPVEPSHRHTQYFEMGGYLSIYHDGWVAAMEPYKQPWDYLKAVKFDPLTQPWHLYDIRSDFSENTDLSARFPEKLEQLKVLFWGEAGKNHVLPFIASVKGPGGVPSINAGRTVFDYPVGIDTLPSTVAPDVMNRSFSITARIGATDDTHGVIATQGGRFGGWGFYFVQGKPVFFYNALDDRQYAVRAERAVDRGDHAIDMNFQYDGGTPGAGGTVTITVDGKMVAKGRVDHTLPNWISHTEGLDIGHDTGTPVSSDYRVEDSTFSGHLSGVRISLAK